MQEVDTLGFRGEALNAIAHLSKMKMSSRHADDELGWQKLYCDDQPPQYIAKEKGTTVHATDLFYTLPVRKLEFEKNYKA
jgi:DNA mismatch repair ATPase MutL